jgi:hypothetical protein
MARPIVTKHGRIAPMPRSDGSAEKNCSVPVFDPSAGTGPTGPEGPAIFLGSGATGSAGPTGAQGITGPTGAASNTGATGPTGLAGFSGPTGPGGTPGVTGATGNTGAAGLSGATGPTGSSAALGGGTGPTGPSGSIVGGTGPTGPTGHIASTGATGAAGAAASGAPTGHQGPAGPAGATGQQGAPLLNGDGPAVKLLKFSGMLLGTGSSPTLGYLADQGWAGTLTFVLSSPMLYPVPYDCSFSQYAITFLQPVPAGLVFDLFIEKNGVSDTQIFTVTGPVAANTTFHGSFTPIAFSANPTPPDKIDVLLGTGAFSPGTNLPVSVLLF